MSVLLEPGRFLVGPAGAYVARVVDVKGPDSAPVAILDGGINHAVRPALVRTEHRLAVLTPDAVRALVRTTVAGPLCTGLDVFTTEAMLPRPRVGDLVAMLDAGRLRLHRVDAALPVASVARGGRGAGRPRPADPAPPDPKRAARPPDRPGLVGGRHLRVPLTRSRSQPPLARPAPPSAGGRSPGPRAGSGQ